MRIIKSIFLDSVSCGSHRARTCAGCLLGNGASWCNGDCQWVNEQCQQKGKGKGMCLDVDFFHEILM